MKVINKIKIDIQGAIKKTFEYDIDVDKIELVFPLEEKYGDYAFNCFALAKELSKNPHDISAELAKNLSNSDFVTEVKSAGPYLNFYINDDFLKDILLEINTNKKFGNSDIGRGQKILIEFSGPNTNKPQHIGHVRNDCLGQSLVNIHNACGYKVIPTNIINDRGIHIVKSMLAWQEFGKGETPESSGVKGDHLVGKYYVKFGQLLKEEEEKYKKEHKLDFDALDNLARRKAEDNFLSQSSWMQKARDMLQKWEANDAEVRKLWKMMNDWVYDGYKQTYADLGVNFDHVDYESDTYLLGKDLVELGLNKKVFFKKNDGSVWIDLTKDGLDEKIVLRSDGTSVYMTQDIGTAEKRYKKFKFDKAVYVVANEQEYHFKVLFLILKKLGFEWADDLHHLSYGMVSLPDGKIKSREGKTADADSIIEEMTTKASEIMSQAQKQVKKTKKEKQDISKIVGLGALKFFMLGTNPQKNITYKAEESISFDGYTGTFIQYTHARISTMLNKGKKIKPVKKLDTPQFELEEKRLLKSLATLPDIIINSAMTYNPADLCHRLFEIARLYNNFYQQHSVLNADDDNTKQIRMNISLATKNTIRKGLELLGIESPEIM
ncbi:arginine--tRNA ligase [Candidatus Parcubacteria bacterium]|jgi:arginyl-tRNA synthetase|nr:arginine--tRNA ligase [Candidatus Parcubacteria bacterium]